MYKCLDCGNVFENGKTITENAGEYFGSPASYSVSVCPYCGEDYEEAYQCERCGEWFILDELTGDYCEDCIDAVEADYKNDADACYKVGAVDKQKIELNSFLAEQFTVDEIEQLLLREVKASGERDFTDFICRDIEWFIEAVKEVAEE